MEFVPEEPAARSSAKQRQFAQRTSLPSDEDGPNLGRNQPKKKAHRKVGKSGNLVGLLVVLMVLIGVMGVGGGVLVYTFVSASKGFGRNDNQAIMPNRPLPGVPGGERPLLFAGLAAAERSFGEPFNMANLTEIPEDDTSKIRFTPQASIIAKDPLFPGGPARPVVSPKPPMSKVGNVNPEAGGNLSPATLERVKRATTFIRVIRGGGRDGTGSGFFVGPGIVMTNAHVVGMLQPTATEPRRIELVLNSGETQEAKFSGQVLAVDRDHDLALVKLSADGNAAWPDPLTIVDGSNLIETQPVFIFGFPLGSSLGKAITVAESRVSSLRRDLNGNLNRIQVNGGMHPGNSGGPVIDAAGNVVGVAVSIIRDTSINFAVSGERANSFLAGRVVNLALGPPRSAASGATEWEIVATLSDPLGQLKRVAVDWWWGSPAERVAAGRTQAGSTNPGRQTVELKRDATGSYRGIIQQNGKLPANRVLWLQVRHEDAHGEAYYEGRFAEPYAVPEPRLVRLRYRPRTGTHPLMLSSQSSLRLIDPEGEAHLLRFDSNVSLTERLRGRDEKEGWIHSLGITKLDVKARSEDQMDHDLGLDDHVEHLPKIRTDYRADTTGRVTGCQMSLSDLPDESRGQLGSFVQDLARDLAFVSMTCPDRELAPKATWQDDREVPVVNGPATAMVRIQLTYRYQGIVRRDSRDLALVEVSGASAGNPNTSTMLVKVIGQLWVDLETGVVTDAFVRMISHNEINDSEDDPPPNQPSSPSPGEGSPTQTEIRLRRQ